MRPNIRALAGVAIVLVCAGFVASRLANEWSESRHALASASIGWIALGVVLAAAGMVTVAFGWRAVLASLGHPLPERTVLAWYFAGEIGKYVPGAVWAVVGRGELATRGGVPRREAYTSVGWSLALWYLVAAAFACGLVPWTLVIAVLAVVALLAFRPGVLPLLVRYVPAWLFIGAATWSMVRALDPNASFGRLLVITPAAWLAGFLVVPAPGGAGVREAAFVALAGSLEPGVAASAAVLARVAFVSVDAVGAAVGGRLSR